jgi:nucleotide-binding universal stress UspA family protein
LIVPATAKFAGIDNIVYTTNFEFRDFGAINYLKNWSKTFDAPIHCLHHIETNENEMSVLKNMSILKETYLGQKRIMFDITQGDFQEKIESFAKSKQADLVAMMSHKRNFISRLVENSAVKGIARDINIPLLVIKDNDFFY